MNTLTLGRDLLVGVLLVPAVVLLLAAAGERALHRIDHRVAQRLRPWGWLTPVLVAVVAVLVYPTVLTLVRSLRGADGTGFVGLDNYLWALTGDNLRSLLNNALWVVLLPLGVVLLGLVMAVLIDRVRYERTARSLLVLPTAISLTAAGISWRLLYSWSPEGRTQLGVLNAVLTKLGLSPVPWIARPPSDMQWLNTVALIGVGVWAGLGLSVLVLSAAVKAVPEELLEAARLDGAGEIRVFLNITLPFVWPSVLTVATTQFTAAVKTFDVVYVMTNGGAGTNVVANQLYTELFRYPSDLGHASAIAVLLLVVTLPVVWFNIRSIRREAL